MGWNGKSIVLGLIVGLIAIFLVVGLFDDQVVRSRADPRSTIVREESDEIEATEVVNVTIPPDREAAAGPFIESPAGASQPSDDASESVTVTPTAAPEATPRTTVTPTPRVPRVGIQAGHWRSVEHPEELARLRNSVGTSGGGVPEWQLNIDVARKVAPLLEAKGIVVDILPATVPPKYQADLFVALHADGNESGALTGFKLARGSRSVLGAVEDRAIAEMTQKYGEITGLRWDPTTSRNMTGYYSFNFRGFEHSVASTTPAVILEMGFMTNRSDLKFLLGSQGVIARGISEGILSFLALSGRY